VTRIGRIKVWFRRIAGELGVFVSFLFLILGNTAAALVGAGLCALLLYGVVATAWRWPGESVKGRDGRAVSPLGVVLWLWWAVLCGGFAWFCAQRAIRLWLGGAG